MRKTPLFLVGIMFFAGVTGCKRGSPTPVPDASHLRAVNERPPSVSADQAAAIVRVDRHREFIGSAAVVGDGTHAVTVIGILGSESTRWRTDLTLGSDRIPAKIVATDSRTGLVLLKAARKLEHAIAPAAASSKPASGAPAVVVCYVKRSTEPTTVEHVQFPATVDSSNYRGESLDQLDLHGTLTVTIGVPAPSLYRGGAAVMEKGTGRLMGIAHGDNYAASGNYRPFVTVPAEIIAAFLKKHGVHATAP